MLTSILELLLPRYTRQFIKRIFFCILIFLFTGSYLFADEYTTSICEIKDDGTIVLSNRLNNKKFRKDDVYDVFSVKDNKKIGEITIADINNEQINAKIRKKEGKGIQINDIVKPHIKRNIISLSYRYYEIPFRPYNIMFSYSPPGSDSIASYKYFLNVSYERLLRPNLGIKFDLFSLYQSIGNQYYVYRKDSNGVYTFYQVGETYWIDYNFPITIKYYQHYSSRISQHLEIGFSSCRIHHGFGYTNYNDSKDDYTKNEVRTFFAPILGLGIDLLLNKYISLSGDLEYYISGDIDGTNTNMTTIGLIMSFRL
jgi:hypothetical protein